MSDWAQRFVGIVDRRGSEGGTENLTAPAVLQSVNPPVITVNGVTISRNIHIDPSLIGGAGSVGAAQAGSLGPDVETLFTEAMDELAGVPGVKDKTMALLEYLQAFLLEMKKFKEEYPLKAGDRVLVRQQGKDFYVSGRVGGG